MTRVLQAELLDALPADNPEAAASRADLRRLNAWMGHRRILVRALKTAPLTGVRRIVELGAGDGGLALGVARELSSRWANVELTLVDQQSLIPTETFGNLRHLGWQPGGVQSDVFDWLSSDPKPADIIFANLFLHHFEEAELRRLFRLAAGRCSCFIALEPRRRLTGRLGCELLWMIACNRVTRHDARISVRAGFRERELSALWPDARPWKLQEHPAGLFSHLFVATRASL